jgi:predicted nuclease with TOPRIM domain
MRLDQFDRLQTLARECSEVILKLKFENKSLIEKNEKMQRELESKSEKTTQKLHRLEEENRILREKQEKVTSRLMHLKNKVRSLSEGAES